MSFTSSYSTMLQAPPLEAYERLSSEENFETLLKLSPTFHTVDLQGIENVNVHWTCDPNSLSLQDLIKDRPTIELAGTESGSASPSGGQTLSGTRVHFRMIERINMLFGALPKDIEIIGSRTLIPSLKLHIYVTEASGGLVTTYKLRRFTGDEADGSQTKVEELVEGQTSWALRRFTETACRDAHIKHMDKYKLMID